MAGAPVISVKGAGKAFFRRGSALRELSAHLTGRREGKGDFWALAGIDLDIRKGEAVGLVGRNGSGKSTLLQLICGTLQPTAGSVTVGGRIAAMLELGAGFNPDFTGRENVMVSAAVHGLSREAIEARLPSILAFADIGEFIDRPVLEYSSGMFARLAFAVCAHVDADILVIDEILGVGDAAFQAKCRRFLENFVERGTVLFVSHDEAAVLTLCRRAVWLEGGRKVADGPAADTIRLYHAAMERDPADALSSRDPGEGRRSKRLPMAMRPIYEDARWQGTNAMQVSPFRASAPTHGYGGAVLTGTRFTTLGGAPLATIHGGEVVALVIEGIAERPIARPILGFIFRNAIGQNLFGDNTFLTHRDQPRPIPAGGTFRAEFQFQMPYLASGTYTLAPSIIEGTQADHVHLCWMEEAVTVIVRNSPVAHGRVGVPMRRVGFRVRAD